MGEVIGPIKTDDWVNMSLLAGSIGYMRKEDPAKYSKAIEREVSLLDQFYGEYGIKKRSVH